MKKIFDKFIRSIKTPQGFFLWGALIFGGAFLLVFPPFQTPDEAAHFLRAYQISNLDFVPQQKNGVTGSDLPKSLQKTESVVDGGTPLQTQPNVKYRLGNTKAALVNVPLNEDEKGFVDTTVTASYSPIGYIPQVIAIWIARVFNAPPILMVYLAKLAVLLAWITLVFWSIKVFPFKKWAVAGIALLPMFIAQSVSMGVDVMAVGAGLLFTSLILTNVYKKQPIGIKTIAFILAAAIVMILSKQVMALLLPLVVLIRFDNAKVSTIKAWIIKSGLVLIPIALFFIWTASLPTINQSPIQVQNSQNTSEQVKYIIENPFRFLLIVANTFLIAGPGDGVTRSLMGDFGWVDTPLAAFFITIGYGALFGYLVINYEKRQASPRISPRSRFIFAAVAALYFIGVCGALYVIFSPVGSHVVFGIQGRYLFPCLFLLIPVFFTNLLIAKEKHFIAFVMTMTTLLFIASFVTIFLRYYVRTP
ncbi:MAG: hypothetical protein JWO54_188 [Candidatus Saccharibacteria bacterium]|nr:hypothetical protein [Candidatus Saccharibacteria bacterium]